MGGVYAVRIYLGIIAISSALLLSGCAGMLSTSAIETSSVQGTALHGKVFGGQQPIVGANVYLYEAGISGYGAAATSLLTSPVNTGSDGSFSISNDYTCPSASTLVYLYTLGGDPSPGIPNSGAGLLAALGACGTLSSSTFVQVNEVSTIATAYAIAAYATDATDVSSPNTTRALTGIANAFAAVPNLETLGTGVALATTPAGNGTVPQSKINTLANILAACINSTGPSSSACSTLFSNAKNGSTAPTDTATAAINIAHNPGANVTALYGLQPATGAPFQPSLSAAPKDFTIAISYTGGGMDAPTSVSVAASGNVWVSSYFYTVSEFSPNGSTAFPAGIGGSGINQSYGMALDIEGNVWIANEQTGPNTGLGNVTELNSSGSALATGLTGGGINYPVAVAADSNGNMWFANYGNSTVTLLNNLGSPVSGASGWGGTTLAYPVAVAVDSSHNAWVANQAAGLSITKISSDGSQVTNYACNCNGASGIATDQNSNVWVANYYGNSISEVNSFGTLVLDAATGGGVDHPQGIAVDGAGNVWVANFLGNSLSEVGGSSSAAPGSFLSPSTGFGADAAMLQPYALAIDASGNIWASNFGSNTLTQFVGVAAPVKTPLAGQPQLP
jgi:streptogramin lyase